jgi:dipeptidase E
MNMILCGGVGMSAAEGLETFRESLGSNAKVLFVPAPGPSASDNDQVLAFLNAILGDDGRKVEQRSLVPSTTDTKLDGFAGLILGGGNTFGFRYVMQETGFGDEVRSFLDHGHTVLGMSAGAIVLGKDVSLASMGDESDENTTGCDESSGLDLIHPFTVHAHYEHEKDDSWLLESKLQPIVALGPTAGLHIVDGTIKVFGEPTPVVQNNAKKQHAIGSEILP